MKQRLKLEAETLVRLSQPALQRIVGGTGSIDACFPDICKEMDSSAW